MHKEFNVTIITLISQLEARYLEYLTSRSSLIELIDEDSTITIPGLLPVLNELRKMTDSCAECSDKLELMNEIIDRMRSNEPALSNRINSYGMLLTYSREIRDLAK